MLTSKKERNPCGSPPFPLFFQLFFEIPSFPPCNKHEPLTFLYSFNLCFHPFFLSFFYCFLSVFLFFSSFFYLSLLFSKPSNPTLFMLFFFAFFRKTMKTEIHADIPFRSERGGYFWKKKMWRRKRLKS